MFMCPGVQGACLNTRTPALWRLTLLRSASGVAFYDPVIAIGRHIPDRVCGAARPANRDLLGPPRIAEAKMEARVALRDVATPATTVVPERAPARLHHDRRTIAIAIAP